MGLFLSILVEKMGVFVQCTLEYRLCFGFVFWCIYNVLRLLPFVITSNKCLLMI